MPKIMCKKWSNWLKAPETYTHIHTHTCNLLLSLKQIGTICFAILISIFSVSSFADNITTSPADCTQPTLSVDTGTANLTAEWEANTIGISWYTDGQKITGDANAATQCTYDQTFSLPTQPTKTGYTFTGWKVVTVPSGYTQLEYIKSDGSQRVDTGIFATENTVIETKFINRTSASDSATRIIIADAWGTSNKYRFSITPQTKSFSNIGSLSITRTSYWQPGTEYTVHMDKDTGETVNGVTTSWTGTANTFTSTNQLRMFNVIDVTGRGAIVDMYYLKIWEGNVLVRDFVPARRNSDNEIGMFDTVSGTFFENAGTGTFTAGPEAQ